VVGFDGYEVNRSGEVRSWRKGGGGLRASPRPIHPWTQQGYLWVNLSNGPQATKRQVHVLVLDAFVGPRPIGMHASHLDGNRANANVCNLVWETPRENNARKINHGTHQAGAAHGQSRLTDEAVSEIRRAARHGGRGTQARLSREYGVSQSQISAIILRRSWRHV
jgi:phenylpropionate dioxygenase-like ring-hydroxylating dioxygenase large terminal subunit